MLRRRGEQRADWQAGVECSGARPAGALSLEVEGGRMWKRTSDEGRGGGDGERSGGGDGVTESADQHLFAVMTGRGRCSRPLLVCRVSQRKLQGLLNPLPPPCQTHHRQPISCHTTDSRCEMRVEVGGSDWLSS